MREKLLFFFQYNGIFHKQKSGLLMDSALHGIYRTLHSYKLFWAVCHLFPQRWRTLTYSVSGTYWPGGPRDMLKTTSARKIQVLRSEPPTRRVFSINTSPSNTLVLFYQISSQQQHTPSSVNQQESEATTWMGLADIQNIH